MPALADIKPQRVAIFRALNLGDLLCAVPALRALRAALPTADIRLIGLPYMAGFAQRFSHYVSSFSSFPGCPGLREQPFRLDAFVRFLEREAQARHDLMIQMHGKGSVTNPIVCMLGAKYVAGYYEPGEFCPDRELCLPYPSDVPEVERHLLLMESLGAERRGRHLEMPLRAEDWVSLAYLEQKHGFADRKYICIHPGARDSRRWWAPRKFARVADALAAKGYSIVFTGTANESPTVERVRSMMRNASVSLAGQTDLGTLGALIARAHLLVSNDTGVSHVAAAMCTPSVVVFLASDPSRWAPQNREMHHIVKSSANDIDRVMNATECALRHSVKPYSAKQDTGS